MTGDFELFVLRKLVEQGVLAEAELKPGAQRDPRGRLDQLVESERLTSRDVAIALAAVCECPYVDLQEFDVDLANASLLSRDLAQSYRAFAVFDFEGCVTVAIADPLDLAALDHVRNAIGRRVEFVHAEPAAIESLVSRAYALHPGEAKSERRAQHSASVEEADASGPIVAAVNELLHRAIDLNASDIHLGPEEHELVVRFRIDGTLHAVNGPERAAHEAIVQRLKVMSGLDLTQTRKPQDGKFRVVHGGQAYDIRLSLLPTVWGENVVMRVLSTSRGTATLADLGFPPDQDEAIKRVLAEPYGVFLVTGPTGSGKTTTLYAALSLLNAVEQNIVTIEDPVELHLARVRQVQVNADIGLTFAGALRSILRQDPDVVLVGEMRDAETARIGVQAALTGHLVLSSLHTNDAPGAITRLLDLDIPPYAINGSLLAVIAQRLVKRLCPRCATEQAPDERLLRRFGLDASETEGFLEAPGCRSCMNSGARGRLAIAEFLAMRPELRDLVQDGAGPEALRAAAIASGMTPIWRDGLAKARAGLTTLQEVARTTTIDDAPTRAETRRAAA